MTALDALVSNASSRIATNASRRRQSGGMHDSPAVWKDGNLTVTSAPPPPTPARPYQNDQSPTPPLTSSSPGFVPRPTIQRPSDKDLAFANLVLANFDAASKGKYGSMMPAQKILVNRMRENLQSGIAPTTKDLQAVSDMTKGFLSSPSPYTGGGDKWGGMAALPGKEKLSAPQVSKPVKPFNPNDRSTWRLQSRNPSADNAPSGSGQQGSTGSTQQPGFSPQFIRYAATQGLSPQAAYKMGLHKQPGTDMVKPEFAQPQQGGDGSGMTFTRPGGGGGRGRGGRGGRGGGRNSVTITGAKGPATGGSGPLGSHQPFMGGYKTDNDGPQPDTGWRTLKNGARVQIPFGGKNSGSRSMPPGSFMMGGNVYTPRGDNQRTLINGL